MRVVVVVLLVPIRQETSCVWFAVLVGQSARGRGQRQTLERVDVRKGTAHLVGPW